MVAFAVALGAISLAVCLGMFVMFRAGDEPDPDVLKVRCLSGNGPKWERPKRDRH